MFLIFKMSFAHIIEASCLCCLLESPNSTMGPKTRKLPRQHPNRRTIPLVRERNSQALVAHGIMSFCKTHSNHEQFWSYFISSRAMRHQSPQTTMGTILNRKKANKQIKLTDSQMTLGKLVPLKIVWADWSLRRVIQN
jgi:hypothetical protein